MLKEALSSFVGFSWWTCFPSPPYTRLLFWTACSSNLTLQHQTQRQHTSKSYKIEVQEVWLLWSNPDGEIWHPSEIQGYETLRRNELCQQGLGLIYSLATLNSKALESCFLWQRGHYCCTAGSGKRVTPLIKFLETREGQFLLKRDRPLASLWALVNQMVSVATVRHYDCSMKTAMDNMYMNGRGYVPIQLHFQKWEASQIWPRRHSLQTSTIEGKVGKEDSLAGVGYFSENMNYKGID